MHDELRAFSADHEGTSLFEEALGFDWWAAVQSGYSSARLDGFRLTPELHTYWLDFVSDAKEDWDTASWVFKVELTEDGPAAA